MTSVLPERLGVGPEDVAAPSPKHVLVREYVRSLAEGLAQGTPMPSERVLVARFGVARMTVRQAIDGLVAEGVLERVPGRGTFVAERGPGPVGPRGLGVELAARGMRADARTLQARRRPSTAGVARALGVTTGEPVWHWRRLRLADGRPLALEDAWFPTTVLPGFDCANPPASLYDALGDRGLWPTSAQDSVAADLASPAEARELGIARTAPVLRVARRCLAGERPVAATRTLFRSDRYAHWSVADGDFPG